jgi:hypothetical protein
MITWVDVADLLTPEQRRHLAQLDDDGIDVDSILTLARHYVRHNRCGTGLLTHVRR